MRYQFAFMPRFTKNGTRWTALRLLSFYSVIFASDFFISFENIVLVIFRASMTVQRFSDIFSSGNIFVMFCSFFVLKYSFFGVSLKGDALKTNIIKLNDERE